VFIERAFPPGRTRSRAEKMNLLLLRRRLRMGVLCAICLAAPEILLAQAGPGPLHPSQPQPPAQQPPAAKKVQTVEPRKSIAGFWKLNPDDSDDPHKKMEEVRGQGGGPGGGGMGGGGPRVGIGFPFPGRGGNGPYGGRGGPGVGGEDSDPRGKMQDLMRPANSVSIDLKDSEVDLKNDEGNKLAIFTDGRKIQKSKDDPVQMVSGRWSAGQLVTDEKGSQGRKVSRTFELSPGGLQFYETWRIEGSKSDSPLVIRYVYDAVNQPRQ